MADSRFYEKSPALSASALAEIIGAELSKGKEDCLISDVASLAFAGKGDVSFLNNSPKYIDQLGSSKAGTVIVSSDKLELVPDGAVALAVNNPHQAYVLAAQYFYPNATRMIPVPGVQDVPVHPSAKIEDDVQIGLGAVIGSDVEIGAGTIIGANAVIGQGCVIGRDCVIGAQSVLAYTMLGDRVLIHPQVAIGQDGFGFSIGKERHVKIPQLGRVILHNDVEIGAGTKIDRGALLDTIIGEGSKIDNLVQIAHNVEIGRHCLIVSHVALAGSSKVGDFVMIGGNSSVVGHLKVGDGVIIRSHSLVTKSVLAGSVIAGCPAKPINQWRKEIAILSRLAKNKK